jgi:hypothetical protein
VYFSSSPVRVTPRRGVQIVSAVYTDKKNVGHLSAIPADGSLAAHSPERKIRRIPFPGQI